MFNRKKVKNLQERILNLERLIFRTDDFLGLISSYPPWTDNPEWRLRSYLDKKFDEKKQELKEAEIRRVAEQVYLDREARKFEVAEQLRENTSTSGANQRTTPVSPSYKE